MSAAFPQGMIRSHLDALAEPEYAAFASKLIPGSPPLLGVRLPALHRLARELACTPDAALAALSAETFEERMLHGLVVAYARNLSPDRRRLLLEDFLPLIDNWSVCDSVAAACRFFRSDRDFWQPWLLALSARPEEFFARFGLVCLKDHFTADDSGRCQLLGACERAAATGLYARLGVAWAASEVCLQDPALGETFLRRRPLDGFTYGKTLAKIRESRRADSQLLALVRSLGSTYAR